MKKRREVFWHITFWLAAISFVFYIAYINSALKSPAIFIVIIGYGIINISLFYLNLLWLMPRFLDSSQYRRYAAAILLAVLLYAIVKYALALCLKPYVLVHPNNESITFGEYIISSVITSTIFILLSTALKFTIDWFNNERIQRDLENQRLSAELAFLKSQINPHFLFNSLNSIYSLAYQRSDDTPGAILKLAEIMRYMLYECNDSKVDLAKELQYLQSYIDMQKIRYGGKVYVDFSVAGEVASQQVVPLLLIAFIENAFKHGIANNPEQPIVLRVTIKPDKIRFYMHNKKHNHNRDVIGGIGLHNVRRRLELLYPGEYDMQVKDEADTYTCELSLAL